MPRAVSTALSPASSNALVSRLREAMGDEAVLRDAASRRYYANDLFWQPGMLPEAIVLPATPQQAAEAIGLACEAGAPVVPRGGAMSYTKGCLPAVRGAIVVDATGLTRILEINPVDAYVTVEAGCTWAALDAALDGTGWRAAFWGPLSGRLATIGGALSQDGAFYGSAMFGGAGDNVIGLSVVLADGSLVRTGSAARRNTAPFTRDGGPDMTGVFVGDNGALGFKVAATLRLTPRPFAVGCLSFGFTSLADMARAQVEMAALQGISEIFGIDRAKVELSASFGQPPEGGAGGRSPLLDHAFTLHLAVEADAPSSLERATNRGARHRSAARRGDRRQRAQRLARASALCASSSVARESGGSRSTASSRSRPPSRSARRAKRSSPPTPMSCANTASATPS